MKDARLDSQENHESSAGLGKGLAEEENRALSIVEVTPIVKGITKESLSYFTTSSVQAGEFVRVPLRSGQVLGVVTGLSDARSRRSDLRNADYTLKKISLVKEVGRISPPFLHAARRLAVFYGTTLGNVLNTLLSKFFLERPELLIDAAQSTRLSREPLLIQMEFDERFPHYKSIIRENFARGSSVMFVVPTHEEALRAYEILGRGITEFTYLFSLDSSRKKLLESYENARSSSHPVLFITTPSGLVFDRPDLETIILEKENSRVYRTLARPFFNWKRFVIYLAHESRKTLIMGDSVLSLESLYRARQGQYLEFLPLKWRVSAASTHLIDMKKPLDEERAEFEIVSDELKSLINKVIEDNSRIYLFGARKGVSSTTVCGDCGSLLSCENCGAPVVLHTRNEKPIYICHACRAERKTETTCDNCGSWKLTALGIGIEKITKELKTLFKNARIYTLDKDTVGKTTEAKKMVKKFLDEGDVLVGTELVFTHLDKIPYTGAVSLDALFSIPDFSINERIFYLITHLREMATKSTLIQTRNIDKEVLKFATEGNVLEFFKSEIRDREMLLYPPFSLFIKISIELKDNDVKEKVDYLRRTFSEWSPDFFKQVISRGKTELNTIIRIREENWPDKKLSGILSLLTPDFLIKVDPDSIL